MSLLRPALTIAVSAIAAPGALLAQDPVKVSPATNTVLKENEYVRVVQSTFKPGAKEGTHSHPAGWYYVTLPGTLKVTSAGGKVEMWDAKAGEQTWSDGEGAHTAENVGKTTLQYVYIEVKGAKPR